MEKKPTILFVDDDDHTRQIYRKQLTKRGYPVHVAHDPVSARFAVKEHPIDWVVLDQCFEIGGHDTSGLDLARELMASYPHFKILIHTGYPSVHAAFFAGKAGCVDYVSKPATSSRSSPSSKAFLDGRHRRRSPAWRLRSTIT